jgi:hypothetical protein
VLFLNDLLPGHRIIRPPSTAGMRNYFQPAFIVFINRVPERFGISCMDQYRYF